jgi:uncharacterized protein (DUF2147 family)
MKKLMVLMAVAIAAFAISASLPAEQAGTTIVGTWKTIDDETGKARSHVKVYKAKDGKYYGKIEKLLNRTKEEGDDPYCKVCPKNDYRYNKRVITMNIVSKMKASSDLKSASGGNILDPKSGKSYKCSMSVKDGGKKLNVRGYMGISALGRTQTWIRIK